MYTTTHCIVIIHHTLYTIRIYRNDELQSLRDYPSTTSAEKLNKARLMYKVNTTQYPSSNLLTCPTLNLT